MYWNTQNVVVDGTWIVTCGNLLHVEVSHCAIFSEIFEKTTNIWQEYNIIYWCCTVQRLLVLYSMYLCSKFGNVRSKTKQIRWCLKLHWRRRRHSYTEVSGAGMATHPVIPSNWAKQYVTVGACRCLRQFDNQFPIVKRNKGRVCIRGQGLVKMKEVGEFWKGARGALRLIALWIFDRIQGCGLLICCLSRSLCDEN